MTPKITLDLSSSGCRKPKCKHRFTPPNRHHVKSEKHWINYFERPHSPPPLWKGDEAKGRRLLRKLKERYHQFREKDVVVICEWHHAEVHVAYTTIKFNYCARTGKDPERLDFYDALRIMRECRRYFNWWITRSSPGVSPKRAGWRAKK